MSFVSFRQPLGLLSLMVCGAVQAGAYLEVIEVKGSYDRSDRQQLLTEALQQVAGGTDLINLDDIRGRQGTLQDALSFTPGIIVQSFFGGNDQPRLNIRGSGIQSNPVNRGLTLLQDDLVLNQADGSFVIGLLDQKDMAHVVLYRGANGLGHGSSSLGGSIHFIGRQADEPHYIRAEVGSFGRYGAAFATNTHVSEHAFRLAASHDRYDGFRHHSSGERYHVALKHSTTIAGNWLSRFGYSYTDNRFDIPFVVPLAVARHQPKAVMGDGATPLDQLLNVYQRKPNRDASMHRLTQQFDHAADNVLWQLGAWWQQLDDTFTDPLSHAVTDSTDLGLMLRRQQFGLLSTEDTLTMGVFGQRSAMQRDYYSNNPQSGQRLALLGEHKVPAVSVRAHGHYTIPLSEHWQLNTTLQYSKQQREIEVLSGMAGELKQNYRAWNPAIGLIYQQQSWRLYGNVSQSHEAPTYWELLTANVSPANPQMARTVSRSLRQQRAQTLELGTTGQLPGWDWSVSLYRSQIDDELMSVTHADAVNGETMNYAGVTIHQGIEAGLTGQIELGASHQLHWRFTYQYSDFYFRDGLYHGNAIAGIPPHMLQFEAGWQFDDIWSIRPNLRWQPQKAAIDHSNTLYQQGYALLGLTINWQPASQWRLFLQADNLTNRIYQSSYVIRGLSLAHQPAFLPGSGRAVTAGLHYAW